KTRRISGVLAAGLLVLAVGACGEDKKADSGQDGKAGSVDTKPSGCAWIISLVVWEVEECFALLGRVRCAPPPNGPSGCAARTVGAR
ncbi:hypothetical protein, partial [Streptomyces xinghaiensis]|uniref:hypothetical protein n=1 Tax=Streptomyces xinghaiensis TaxID=1038928 RepID=UPI001ABF737B